MLCGIPSSGKTTYVKQNFKEKGYHIYSSSMVRKDICHNGENINSLDEIFHILHKRIKEDLKNGISCIYDATNLRRSIRSGFLREIKLFDCLKICYVFATPIEVCKERQKLRVKNPEKAEKNIETAVKKFECPYYYEGWDDSQLPIS